MVYDHLDVRCNTFFRIVPFSIVVFHSSQHYVLYLLFFPTHLSSPSQPLLAYSTPSSSSSNLDVRTSFIPTHQGRRWTVPLGSTVKSSVVWITLLTLVFLGIGYDAILDDFGSTYAMVLSYFSAGLSILQYGPQIQSVWKTQQPGAFSILTLSVQCPGTLILVWTFLHRPSIQWIHVLSYLISMLSQAILLILLLATHTTHPHASPLGGSDESAIVGPRSHDVSLDDELHLLEGVLLFDETTNHERNEEKEPLLKDKGTSSQPFLNPVPTSSSSPLFDGLAS
ncbi:hypothetical protein HMI54_014973 [Coelomomyces lativittatus]|nr:hypothetical protein HMI54_014973 [Coelomomyces lativittatus]